jgi:hypothetical protein
MPIGSLNTATPGSGEVAGTSGPSELKGIKTEIRASFPNFTAGNDVVTKTASQLNDAPQKGASETITGAWSFIGDPTKNGWSIANVNEATSIANSAVASYVSTVLSSAVAVPGVWNFINGLQASGLTAPSPSGLVSLALSCGNANAFLTTTAGSIQVSANGAFDLVDGSALRVRDATSADSASFSHDGTNFLGAFVGTTNWLITGISNILLGSDTLATQAYAANYTVSALNSPQTIPAVWNFSAGLQSGGASVATQAWANAAIAAERCYGKCDVNISGAGTGSVVLLTGTANAVPLENVTHNSGAGTLTVAVAGDYRVVVSGSNAFSGATGLNANFGFMKNGGPGFDTSVQVSSSIQNSISIYVENLVTLAANDTISLGMNIPVGVNVSGSLRLTVQRIGA